jgi:hypothetical protein
MSLGIRRDQVPEYLSQFESSATFLRHMRDKHKPGTSQYEQFNREYMDCLGQAARLKTAYEKSANVAVSIS